MNPLRLPDNCQEVKTIHFVRHAEGLHNVAGRANYENYKLEEYADSLLSERGYEQCARAKEDIVRRNALVGGTLELIVVSPLRRTLQTASLLFADKIGTSVEFVAVEHVREQTGAHPCDRRRSITEQKADFPHVDFSLIEDDVDPLYCKYESVREPSEEVAKRVNAFWHWIASRKEKNIAVVTHSAYLRHFKWPTSDASAFANCELRSIVYQFPLPPDFDGSDVCDE